MRDSELLDALERCINKTRGLVLWDGIGEFPGRCPQCGISKLAGLSLLQGRRTLREALIAFAVIYSSENCA